jgi:RNA-binding protein 39
VVEADLEMFFSHIGKVKSVIMLRDRITDAHKGFAYVEMAELDAIPNCLLFNNVVPDFQKFPILVKPSEAEKNIIAKKDPFIIKNVIEQAGPDTRIYLGNIHVGLDENALKAVLDQFGPVETVKLHRDHLGNSKGFAFVKFLRAESANLAMSTLPGFELAGRPLKVGPVTDAKAAGMSVGQMMPGMPTGTDEVVNWKLDADEGGAGLPMNANTRMMLMAKLAQKAGIQVPAPVSFPAAPAPAGNVADRPVITGTPSRFVLISNMFDPLTETEPDWDRDIKEDVTEECSSFGQVANCYVEKRKPGGHVYIEMRQVDSAVKVANALNGRYFAKRLIRCSYLDERTFADATR